MTLEDCAPYQSNRELLDFRRFFGPERRDILMLWRNHSRSSSRKDIRESPAGCNVCRPISTASITASHCRSSIGRRPVIITFGIFRSIPTDENGLIEKVGESIPSPISCGRAHAVGCQWWARRAKRAFAHPSVTGRSGSTLVLRRPSRRALASVRGRRKGRHQMGFAKDRSYRSTDAWS